MTFRRIIRFLHLWIGLISGILVFIIALTGSIYTFKEEIENALQSYRFVDEQDVDFLLPSQIKKIADEALPNKNLHAVMYQKGNHAAKAIYYQDTPEEYYYFVYINPYTGEILQVRDENSTFFSFILDGHFNLWLPDEPGRFIVATSTLVFLGMMISGLILWWPRNKSQTKQRFKIKWNVRWRRRNFDLHHVLGFYASWLGIIFAITGLVWGFEWFLKSYYNTISGGESYVEYYQPSSAIQSSEFSGEAIDLAWLKLHEAYSEAGAIEIHIPVDSSDCIAASVNPDPTTYWQIDYRYFDQYTLQEIPVKHLWGRFQDATTAHKLMRMNYDIHVGAIAGLPGKILVFLAGLVIASLPITGFLIWWGRKNK